MIRRRLATLIVIALALAPFAASAQVSDAMTVVVDAVKVEPLSRSFRVIGRLVVRQRGIVAARTRGAVSEMRVQIGDRVAAGDVLAVIDPDRLTWRRDLVLSGLKESLASVGNAEARLAVARAGVKTAEARLALVRQELDRLESLRNSVAFSQARRDDKALEVRAAESGLTEAEAQVQEALSLIDQVRARVLSAEAKLRLAEDDLANSVIRAPFAGVITLRHTEAGAFLEVGDAVVTLVNDTDLEVEADVPFDRLVGITPGVEVDFVLDDGSRHTAVVRAVGIEENPKTRTRPVRFTPRFETPMTGLADGQSATLELPIGLPRDIVSVHKDALVHSQGRTIVYVVVDGAAEARPVALGVAVGQRFEVLDGLAPGDLVVVRGNERLRPGQAVTFDGST